MGIIFPRGFYDKIDIAKERCRMFAKKTTERIGKRARMKARKFVVC